MVDQNFVDLVLEFVKFDLWEGFLFLCDVCLIYVPIFYKVKRYLKIVEVRFQFHGTDTNWN